jgi:hypothetical protein
MWSAEGSGRLDFCAGTLMRDYMSEDDSLGRLNYTNESKSVNSAFANLSSRIGASGLGLQLCRLSPAAWEGKEANKSGCLGSGFSLFISLLFT